MTEIKLDAKLNAPIVKALEPHADELLAAPLGTRVVALVELSVVEHAERGDSDDEVAHVVKIRPVLMEIATGDDEHHLRRAHRALWSKRTAEGTITGDADRAQAEGDIRYVSALIGGDG